MTLEEMKIYLKFLKDEGVEIKSKYDRLSDTTTYTINGASFPDSEYNLKQAERVLLDAFKSINKTFEDAIPHDPMKFNFDNLTKYLKFLENNGFKVDTNRGTYNYPITTYSVNGKSFSEQDSSEAERILMKAFQSIGKTFEEAENAHTKLRI